MSDLGPEFATQMCERPQDHLAAMAARGSCPWGGLTDRRQVVERIADQVVVDWRTRSVVVPTAAAVVAGIAALVLVRIGNTEWLRRQTEEAALSCWLAGSRFPKGTTSITVQVVGGEFEIVSK